MWDYYTKEDKPRMNDESTPRGRLDTRDQVHQSPGKCQIVITALYIRAKECHPLTYPVAKEPWDLPCITAFAGVCWESIRPGVKKTEHILFHCEGSQKCIFLALFLVVKIVGRPLANDHPEGPASFIWSSGRGRPLAKMIIQRGRPLAVIVRWP